MAISHERDGHTDQVPAEPKELRNPALTDLEAAIAARRSSDNLVAREQLADLEARVTARRAEGADEPSAKEQLAGWKRAVDARRAQG